MPRKKGVPLCSRPVDLFICSAEARARIVAHLPFRLHRPLEHCITTRVSPLKPMRSLPPPDATGSADTRGIVLASCLRSYFTRVGESNRGYEYRPEICERCREEEAMCALISVAKLLLVPAVDIGASFSEGKYPVFGVAGRRV